MEKSMSSSFRDVIRNVFSNRNILVISITTSLWSVCNMGWRPYWSLYLKHVLKASIPVVGMLSMIQSSSQLLFQLPGGILADRFGRRRIIVYGTVFRLIPPIIYLLATTWVHVIPALLISAMTSIYMPAFNAIIADSLPHRQRGAGYGAYRMITSLPRIFMPFIGGIVMDMMGYEEGVRVFLFATIFVSIVIIIARTKFLEETLIERGRSRSTRATFTSAFEVPRTIWVMMVVATLGGFALRLVMPFMSIYAIDIIGLTNTQLGLVQTLSSIISTLLSMPGGMLSDRFGRKPIILATRCITPLTTWGITIAKNFLQYLTTQFIGSVGAALGGGIYGFAGGPAWQALVADLVPREKRGTIMGTIGTITGMVGAPSSWIGGYLWKHYTPQMPFNISLILGLVATAIFGLFVKEPEKREE